ncbi:MAG: 50S ribosomal protein L6 [Candidatus Andersenbacteria bacterium]|nr:50S ribosomal protein L6 [Candidatus Andersenbacteria bacterium]MBI3251055.1 50S ribosomal protein L6 [Candidatus Andersenbacteria bacterium]
MSRIGKQPITLPTGVTATVEYEKVIIKGAKGEITRIIHPDIKVVVEGNVVTCSVVRQSKQASALWGTTRAVIASAAEGVSAGVKKQLELQGVGYRAAVKGKNLELLVGFSHPVKVDAPEHITFSVEKEIITVEGVDPIVVGQTAANIRKIRPPEPYKGKGIRYVGEHVRRKAGKVVGATTA